MHARLLDMLEDPGDRDVLAVADRIDVDLDRVAQIAVDQNRARSRHRHRRRNVMLELFGPVDDLHSPAAEHIGRAEEHRITDACRDRERLVAASGDAVGGLLEAQFLHQPREPLAILGKVDRSPAWCRGSGTPPRPGLPQA